MINLIGQGLYKLVETPGKKMILILDRTNYYEWFEKNTIGTLCLSRKKLPKDNHCLSLGKYRLYKIDSELKITNNDHLELLVGINAWQGYLLPSGLPSSRRPKVEIRPTMELITKVNKAFD